MGAALDAVWDSRRRNERLVWVPSPELHGLPVHALRARGRYLVEDHEVVYTLSGALYLHHARLPRPSWWRRRRVLVVTAAPPEVAGTRGLRYAQAEGRGVAAAFACAWNLHHGEATRARIAPLLGRVAAAHFACHALFEAKHPLAAWIHLPSGEPWYAPHWLAASVKGLPLVTLSTCQSAEMAPALGGEVFGLATGLLGAGVRAVVGGLCRIPDRETATFMWRFYRHALTNDLAGRWPVPNGKRWRTRTVRRCPGPFSRCSATPPRCPRRAGLVAGGRSGGSGAMRRLSSGPAEVFAIFNTAIARLANSNSRRSGAASRCSAWNIVRIGNTGRQYAT